MIVVNKELGECLRDQGMNVAEDGFWLKMDGHPYAIRGRFISGEDASVGRLDIQMPFPDGRFLWESYSGRGEDLSAAKERGFENFMEAGVKVLLAGFCHHRPDQVKAEAWTALHRPLTAFISDLTIRSENDDIGFCPEDLLQTLQQLIRHRDCDKDVHWIRVFVAQNENNEMFTEVLWDNRVWIEGERAVAHLDWKPASCSRTARVFIVLKPSDTDLASEPEDEVEGAQAECIVETMLGLPLPDQKDPALLKDLLTRLGFEQDQIKKVMHFVPVALGRNFLKEMDLDFSDTFFVLDANGEVVNQGILSEEPVFTAALEIEPDLIGGDLFGLHALGSAEVVAINQAFEGGSNREDLPLEPVVFFEQPPSEEGRQRGRAILQNLASLQAREAVALNQPSTGKKSWWKLWG